jgi:hypothetical protein
MSSNFIEEANVTTGWTASPTTRGTFDIFTSCLFTLVICISTVLHLNVPPYGTSWRQLMWTKTRWILCGLIAPEIVVLTALDQWLIARGQRELVNEYLKSNNILKPRKVSIYCHDSFFRSFTASRANPAGSMKRLLSLTTHLKAV